MFESAATSLAPAAGEGLTTFGGFAGMLSHELRNPLTAAATNLAVASDLCDESDPRAPFLRRAEHELDRIAALLRSCLTLARAGRVERAGVDVACLVATVARAHSASAAIEVDVPPSLAFACDPMLVERALANLCDNATRAIGEVAGRVRVSAALDVQEAAREAAQPPAGDADLVLVVEDSGPGVDPELAGSVFEPFVSAGGGTGLGLAFVRQVARAHGGDVTLTSSPLGGARFEVRLAPPAAGI